MKVGDDTSSSDNVTKAVEFEREASKKKRRGRRVGRREGEARAEVGKGRMISLITAEIVSLKQRGRESERNRGGARAKRGQGWARAHTHTH